MFKGLKGKFIDFGGKLILMIKPFFVNNENILKYTIKVRENKKGSRKK